MTREHTDERDSIKAAASRLDPAQTQRLEKIHVNLTNRLREA